MHNGHLICPPLQAAGRMLHPSRLSRNAWETLEEPLDMLFNVASESFTKSATFASLGIWSDFVLWRMRCGNNSLLPTMVFSLNFRVYELQEATVTCSF